MYVYSHEFLLKFKDLPHCKVRPKQIENIKFITINVERKKKMNGTSVGVINSLFNKLSIEKFDKVSQQIASSIRANGLSQKFTISDVVNLFYNKSIIEHHFIDMYVKLIKKIEKQDSRFTNILIEKCNLEFNNYMNKFEFEKETFHLSKKQFIGFFKLLSHLYIYSYIGINEYITRLLTESDEKYIEAVCNILTLVGQRINKENRIKYCNELKQKRKSNIPNKVKFFIDDIIQLNENDWIPMRMYQKKEGPSKKSEIKLIKKYTKKVLCDESINNIVLGIIKEYLVNLDFEDCKYSISKFNNYSNNTQIKKRFISNSFDFIIEQNETKQNNFIKLLDYLICNRIIETEYINEYLINFEKVVDDIRIDIPKIDNIIEKFEKYSRKVNKCIL